MSNTLTVETVEVEDVESTIEPAILTANTFYWTPATSASTRRYNQEKRQTEVATFFESIGLKVTRNGDNVIGENDTIKAFFSYSESCKNVYKTLAIIRADNFKKSNITALRKLYV